MFHIAHKIEQSETTKPIESFEVYFSTQEPLLFQKFFELIHE